MAAPVSVIFWQREALLSMVFQIKCGECMYTWGLVVKQFDPGFPQPTCRIVLGLYLQFVSVDDCVINSWHLCEWGEV